jgi:hypothetical protein
LQNLLQISIKTLKVFANIESKIKKYLKETINPKHLGSCNGTATLSIITLTTMTLNRMTLSIINLFVTLNLNDTQHNNIQQNCIEYRVPLCWVLNFLMAMLSVVMLNAIMLSVVMLSVMAPLQ